MADDVGAWLRWIAGVAAAAFGALIMWIMNGLKGRVDNLEADSSDHRQQIPTQYVSRPTFTENVREREARERELRELVTSVNERMDAQRRDHDVHMSAIRSEMNGGFAELRRLLIDALKREG